MAFLAISDIIGYLVSILIMLLIVQFVISLLFSFNVIDRYNELAGGIYRGVNALLAPLLRPIQRLMPDTGAIDFSPLVLLMLAKVVQILLNHAAAASLQ